MASGQAPFPALQAGLVHPTVDWLVGNLRSYCHWESVAVSGGFLCGSDFELSKRYVLSRSFCPCSARSWQIRRLVAPRTYFSAVLEPVAVENGCNVCPVCSMLVCCDLRQTDQVHMTEHPMSARSLGSSCPLLALFLGKISGMYTVSVVMTIYMGCVFFWSVGF